MNQRRSRSLSPKRCSKSPRTDFVSLDRSTNTSDRTTLVSFPSSVQIANAKKAKRGPSVKLFGDEMCSICGRKADGFHYNVLSCQGCKGFFRRTILQNSEYVCRTGRGGCDLKDVDHARQRCQKCRIERCYEAGMLEKYVRRKKNRTRTMRILENMKRPSVIVESYTTEESDLLTQALKAWHFATDDKRQIELLKPLFRKVHQMAETYKMDSMQQKNMQMNSFFCIKLHLVVRFCSALKPFQRFTMDEQKLILSKTMVELFVLHTWPKYIPAKNGVRTFDGSIITPERLLAMGSHPDFVDETFSILRQLTKLELTDEATGILCSLVTFSPDRDYPLELAEKVDEVQQDYVAMLVRYVQRNYAFKRNYMARLLSLLPKLRFFSEGTIPKYAKAFDVFENLAPRLVEHMMKSESLSDCLDTFARLIPTTSSLCKTEP